MTTRVVLTDDMRLQTELGLNPLHTPEYIVEHPTEFMPSSVLAAKRLRASACASSLPMPTVER
jgi:hypothetical protein